MSEAAPTAFTVAGHTIPAPVVDSIRRASEKTGVSFSFLMAQASRESAFRPTAQNSKSTAAGLFQFTAGTWLELVHRHGQAHGLGEASAKIRRSADGRLHVDDPQARRDILNLRRDPELAAVMAAEYARDNRAHLERNLQRQVGWADLYLAHFLGPGGALRMLKAHASDDSQLAADLLPEAARSNPQVFFARMEEERSARSVANVYESLSARIERPMRQFAALKQELGIGVPPPPGVKPETPAPAPVMMAQAQPPAAEPPPIPQAKPTAPVMMAAVPEPKPDAPVLVATAPPAKPEAPVLVATAPPPKPDMPVLIATAPPPKPEQPVMTAAAAEAEESADPWLLAHMLPQPPHKPDQVTSYTRLAGLYDLPLPSPLDLPSHAPQDAAPAETAAEPEWEGTRVVLAQLDSAHQISGPMPPPFEMAERISAPMPPPPAATAVEKTLEAETTPEGLAGRLAAALRRTLLG
ncbi:transglycosylase SLT domain-containing protein [Telmatospirillum sp. J64-1]|uniref:transglycosylase SLT domain-containing protein n=1 Tax=Telmatospirillum sp. J64-1 TaxID=2502183 RepID=UPI00115C8546|nr:transglycosylase SLT domain-containing protein [Telmatospirillum sp. J64-1]